jgi:hypothetical protein
MPHGWLWSISSMFELGRHLQTRQMSRAHQFCLTLFVVPALAGKPLRAIGPSRHHEERLALSEEENSPAGWLGVGMVTAGPQSVVLWPPAPINGVDHDLFQGLTIVNDHWNDPLPLPW